MIQDEPRVCPRCRGEFRAGIERCADCGVELVASRERAVAEPVPSRAARWGEAPGRLARVLARPWQDAGLLVALVIPSLAVLLVTSAFFIVLPRVQVAWPRGADVLDFVLDFGHPAMQPAVRPMLPLVLLFVLAAGASVGLWQRSELGRQLALMFVVVDLALRLHGLAQTGVVWSELTAQGWDVPFPAARVLPLAQPALFELYLVVVLLRARRLVGVPAARPATS